MNPLEEFLSLNKQASLPMPRQAGLFGQIGNFMAQGLGAGLGAAALTGGALAVKNIYNAATAKKDFRDMLQWNQDLQGADQSLLNQSFRSLRRFAPDMAKDPLVAGSMVRRMVQAPEGAAGIMGEAISGQGRMPSHVMESFTQAAGRGLGEGVKGFQPFGLPPATVPLAKAHEIAEQGERKLRDQQFSAGERERLQAAKHMTETSELKRQGFEQGQHLKTLRGFAHKHLRQRGESEE